MVRSGGFEWGILRTTDRRVIEYINIKEREKIKSNFQELLELFKSIDVDNDHSLCLSEVVTFLKSITDDLSTENIENIFDSLDQSGDRSVDFVEFKVNNTSFFIFVKISWKKLQLGVLLIFGWYFAKSASVRVLLPNCGTSDR